MPSGLPNSRTLLLPRIEKHTVPTLLALLLSGCAQHEAMLSYFAQSCEREGIAPGTPAYQGCIDNKHRAQMMPGLMMMQRPSFSCQTFGSVTRCN